MEENKIKKYIIFIMPYSLYESSGLDTDTSLEEVKEFAKKQNGKVTHRVFDSERDCLVYFMALCDSGKVFGENIYYYLFTEPTVEPIDEPMFTWFGLIREFVPSYYESLYEATIVGLRKLNNEPCDDLSEDAIYVWTCWCDSMEKHHLADFLGVVYSELIKEAATNYFLDKYVGYIDPELLPEKSHYLEFMKENRDYPELRDK